MAQRERDKAKRGTARPKESGAGHSDALQRLEARAKALERERDGLKAELERARARIAVLEERGSQVANRIDWVIDSLHNLAGKNA
jgi:predicted RNase H-like nuclease (RuvC/YqgF family)